MSFANRAYVWIMQASMTTIGLAAARQLNDTLWETLKLAWIQTLAFRPEIAFHEPIAASNFHSPLKIAARSCLAG